MDVVRPTRVERGAEVAGAPLSIDDLRNAARLGGYAGADAQLGEIMLMAVDWMASYLGQSPFLAEQTAWYDRLGCAISLGVPNVDESEDWSLQWLESDGTAQTVTSDDPQGWEYDDSSMLPRLLAPVGFDVPRLDERRANPASAKFVAGVSADRSAENVMLGVAKMLVADLYLIFPSTEPLQMTAGRAEKLMSPWAVRAH